MANKKEKAIDGVFISDKIMQDQKLNLAERVIYSQIFFLTHDNGVCFATNEYFAKKLNISIRTISSSISSLMDKKYIIIQRNTKKSCRRGIIRYSKSTIARYERGDFDGTGVILEYKS